MEAFSLPQHLQLLSKVNPNVKETVKGIYAVLPSIADIETATEEGLLVILARVAERKLKITVFPNIKRFLYELPLAVEVEPVNVGLGVVIKPTNIDKAGQVIVNSTLPLIKQKMLEVIVQTIQSYDWVDLDYDFFMGFLNRWLYIKQAEWNLGRNTFEELLNMVAEKFMSLILQEKLEPGRFGVTEQEVNFFRGIQNTTEKILNLYQQSKLNKNLLTEGEIKNLLAFLEQNLVTSDALINLEIFNAPEVIATQPALIEEEN